MGSGEVLAYLEFPAEFSEVTRARVIVPLLKEQRRAVCVSQGGWVSSPENQTLHAQLTALP